MVRSRLLTLPSSVSSPRRAAQPGAILAVAFVANFLLERPPAGEVNHAEAEPELHEVLADNRWVQTVLVRHVLPHE